MPSSFPQVGLLSLVGILALCGCTVAATDSAPYQFPEYGYRIQVPSHWSVENDERAGIVGLQASDSGQQGVLLVLVGSACSVSNARPPQVAIDSDLDRIADIYELETVVMLESAQSTRPDGLSLTQATIEIPTLAMPEDSKLNQMGVRETGVFQTIDIYHIRDQNDHNTLVYLYRGLSESLNAEAHAIVDSIQGVCD